MKKAIVVGRHQPDLGATPKFEVAEVREVLFAATSQEAIKQLYVVINDADAIGAVVLLQNVPGQLAAGLTREAWRRGICDQTPDTSELGVIISVPAPAGPDGKRPFVFSHIEWFC